MSDTGRGDELRDREAAGDLLSPGDREFLETLETADPDRRRETEAWGNLVRHLGRERDVGMSDVELANVTLARARARPRPAGRRWLAAGAVAGVAAATVLWWQQTLTEPRAPHETAMTIAPAPSRLAALTAPPEPSGSGLAAPGLAGPGLAFHDGQNLFAGTSLESGVDLRAARAGCFHLTADKVQEAIQVIQICASADAQFQIVASSAIHSELRLHKGSLTASVDHDQVPAGHTFTIATQVASVTAVGTVFTVEVTTDGRIRTRVEEGTVEVVQGTGRVQVGAGQERVLHDPANKRPKPARVAGATTLRKRAEAARVEGRFQAAVDLYKRLLSSYPHSAEAAVALVALGDLQLDKLGNPRAALRAYDRYLRRAGSSAGSPAGSPAGSHAGSYDGSLAEEAWNGQIRALRKLGQTDQERQSIEAYLHRYPSGFYAGQLRARLNR